MEICVSGNTKVVLHKGNKVAISDLLEKGTVKIYAGEFKEGIWLPVIKEAKAKKIGEKEIIKVIFEDGNELECTPDQKLALKDSEEFVEAKDSVDKVIATYNHKGVKVVEVVNTGETKEVYDMEVKDAECFYINDGKMTILIHTCS